MRFITRFKLFLFMTLFFDFSHSSDLEGIWFTDAEAIIKFNESNKQLNDLRASLIKCLAENTEVVFRDGIAINKVSSHNCNHKNKSAVIEGYEVKYKYEIIYSNLNQTVMLNSNEYGENAIEVINWIDSDNFWIDLQEDDFKKLRTRYFYVRVKQ